MPSLDRITIQGFKSIRSLENFELRQLNVLVGANGAGKSNFLEFFALLRAMCGFSLPFLPVSGLANYSAVHGGCERILHNGSRTTSSLTASLEIEGTTFSLELLPTVDDELVFARHDGTLFHDGSRTHGGRSGQRSFKVISDSNLRDRQGLLYRAIASWQLFHFQATDLASGVRKSSDVADTAYLRPDASNLAAFLLHLYETEPESYQEIVRAIRLVAPYFDDFEFKKQPGDRIRLFWRAVHSDYVLGAHQFSDGTLRYIALATAFLQPNPPSIMLVDEPELGQHPQGLAFLGGMVQTLPPTTKVILATKSPAFLDFFEPEDVVVVRRQNGASVFERLKGAEYENWLCDYSLGDLWRKNVICAGPETEYMCGANHD